MTKKREKGDEKKGKRVTKKGKKGDEKREKG